jgi:hypothetical protein
MGASPGPPYEVAIASNVSRGIARLCDATKRSNQSGENDHCGNTVDEDAERMGPLASLSVKRFQARFEQWSSHPDNVIIYRGP